MNLCGAIARGSPAPVSECLSRRNSDIAQEVPEHTVEESDNTEL